MGHRTDVAVFIEREVPYEVQSIYRRKAVPDGHSSSHVAVDVPALQCLSALGLILKDLHTGRYRTEAFHAAPKAVLEIQPPKLSIGYHFQAYALLHGHRLANAFILHPPQLCGVDLASIETVAGLLKPLGT